MGRTGNCLDVWMSHGDKVSQLPPDFELIAETDSCPIAGMAHRDKPWFGIQFHPEVTHTLQGEEIFPHFVLIFVAARPYGPPPILSRTPSRGCASRWATTRCCWVCRVASIPRWWRRLLHRAIGDQLTCVFVDNGLLRLNEGDQVMAMFAQNMGVKVIRADAEERFFSKLAGVSDPEAKRKAIGNTFIEVFDEEAAKSPT
jgi:GMP synthase (glutamine-hydrolysing)